MQENSYPISMESASETARLLLQNSLLTQAMGGVLPPDYDLSQTQRILDVACGPGGWALKAASQLPAIEIVGVDLSNTMIHYAQDQANTQHLQNIHFAVMDVRQPLDFPDESFDLINMRFLFSFMPPSLWPSLLLECKRLLRPGGRVRWTEMEPASASSTSPAYETLGALLIEAMAQKHLTFSERSIGLVPHMGKLLRDADFQIIEKRGYLHESSFGTALYQASYDNALAAIELTKEYVIAASLASKEQFEALQKQMEVEMRSPDYCCVTCIHTWLAEQSQSPSAEEGSLSSQ